jgi:hypothetical protein
MTFYNLPMSQVSPKRSITLPQDGWQLHFFIKLNALEKGQALAERWLTFSSSPKYFNNCKRSSTLLATNSTYIILNLEKRSVICNYWNLEFGIWNLEFRILFSGI